MKLKILVLSVIGLTNSMAFAAFVNNGDGTATETKTVTIQERIDADEIKLEDLWKALLTVLNDGLTMERDAKIADRLKAQIKEIEAERAELVAMQ